MQKISINRTGGKTELSFHSIGNDITESMSYEEAIKEHAVQKVGKKVSDS
jgi:hypothetical protein